MGPILEKFERDAVLIIYEGIQNGYSLLALRQKLSGACPDFLSSRERRALVSGGEALYRAGRAKQVRGRDLENFLVSTVPLRQFEHVLNTVHYSVEKKAKAITVLGPIEQHRAQSGVFYMVSIHQKPACGHAPWQGKIVVDRRWRSLLGSDSNTISRVEKYLAEHEVPRLQDLMNDPVWLVTRRNCRHKFIPIGTYEVLTTSVNAIRDAHPEVYDHAHRSLTPKQVYAKKKARVKNIKLIINKKSSVAV